MFVDVTSEISIARPCAIVAEYAANPDNVPQWYVNIRSVEWQGEAHVGVGAKIAFVAQFLGKRLAYTYEIVEYLPNQRLVMRTAEGPFPMETTYIWEAMDSTHTRMQLRNRGEPRGFSRLLAPFMAKAIARANRKDLACLKAKLEQSA